jgi:hypothetical protein
MWINELGLACEGHFHWDALSSPTRVGLAEAGVCGQTDRGGYAVRPALDQFKRFLNWDAVV